MVELLQNLKKLFRKPAYTLIQELKVSENIPDPSLLERAKKTVDSGETSLEFLRHYYALKYRLGQKIQPIQEIEDLISLALSWKRDQPIFNQATLSANELNQLKEASKYNDFIQLLKSNKELQAAFFTWILRDGNESVPFIEFPDACNRIISAQLSGRINQNGISYLQMLQEGNRKILALPFEGQYRNILDPQAKVVLRGNYILTIQEIFEIFAKKDIDPGNLEFFQEGIVNWNLHKLGYWNADLQKYEQIDVSKETWWEALPLLEVINRKQVFKRYGLALKENEWILSPVATRSHPNLDFKATHAFLEIVIPFKNNYAVYNFGKLATVYPSNTFDQLKMLTKTVHATIAYPDDNCYYKHRQRGFHPFILKAAQGRHLMQLISRDIEASRALKIDYQIQSENCAKWVFHKLEEVLGKGRVPNFFRIQLLDTEPGGVIERIFAYIKKLPSEWRVPVLMFFHIPLGAKRTLWIEQNGGWVPKSLHRHPFFKTGQVYLPALLIHKVQKMKTREFLKTFIKPKIFIDLVDFIPTWRNTEGNAKHMKFFLRSQGSFFTPIL